jgi:hypothetical protein
MNHRHLSTRAMGVIAVLCLLILTWQPSKAQVTKLSGVSVPNAQVFIKQDNGEQVSNGLTGANGTYRFSVSTIGKYNVVVENLVGALTGVLTKKGLMDRNHSGTFSFLVQVGTTQTKGNSYSIKGGSFDSSGVMMLKYNGGPYSQSVSNIEDNGIVVVVTTDILERQISSKEAKEGK